MSANAKQQEAITLIKQGKNVFLTGPGGCGKSWVIEQITCPDTIVVAPTGVAALNVKGSTCHSAFGMPIGLVRKMDIVNISRKVRQRFDNNSRVKRIILDECFKGDVEILTANGFVRFDQLDRDLEVAQFDADDCSIDFVPPTRHIVKEYSGDMTCFRSKYKFNLSCTSNHNMLVQRPNGDFQKLRAKDLKMTQKNYIKASGKGVGDGQKSLTTMERLCIAFQADGSSASKKYSENLNNVNMAITRYGFTPKKECGSMFFSFKKSRKIDRFIKLFSSLDIVDYGVNGRGYRSFLVRNVPSKYITKDFSECFEIKTFSHSKARDFLNEVAEWDGSVISENSFVYSNTNKSSCDFVQTICVLGGAISSLTCIPDDRKETYSDCYKVTVVMNRDFSTTSGVKKESCYFQGKVYCVEVEKGNIIVRSNGRTHIVGNCSMLRSDYLDLIDMKLKKIRGNNKPFGGIQVVVVGDFFQLPPIVSENEKEHFYEQYETPFAFGAKCWNFSTVELTEVVRQNDLEQVALLNNIRKGISTKESLDKVRDISLPHHNKDMVFLCCYNNDASKINRQQYHQINAKEYVFVAHTSGNWGKEEPSPLKLRVKVGMKVIMCSNNPSQGYVNGDRGRIEHVTDDWNVYVRLDNGTLVKVDHAVWEKYSYNKTGGTLNKEVVASYRQLPIKYGWAVSVHKSQGMTLDGVTIDVGHGCFSHGQLYVALSRVKDLSNIYLMNNITEEDVIIEQEVRNFYES